MTDLVLFALGSLVFLAVTWATVAFGVARVHEMQYDDMEESERIAWIEDRALTEIYKTRPVAGGRP